MMDADMDHIMPYLKLWVFLPHKELNKTWNNTRLNNFLYWRTAFW